MIPALLALEDGSLFEGHSVGAPGVSTGIVAFHTSPTGYQELLTDPVNAGVLLALTSVHIGNGGCNDVDAESERVQAAGLIVRDLARRTSSWREHRSLGAYLAASGTVAIAGIDTRRLTRLLRAGGGLRGCIMAGNALDAESALDRARQAQGLDALPPLDRQRAERFARNAAGQGSGPLILALDLGIKRSTIRMLLERGCRVRVVAGDTPLEELLAANPAGVLVSSGPGNPETWARRLPVLPELVRSGVPVFGIGLGCQLLALAAGARTLRLPSGHHGANHPVRDLATGRVLITGQNHFFAVDAASLPTGAQPTHVSLFDGSLQGFRLTDAPVAGFQGEPGTAPGPHEAAGVLDEFLAAARARAGVSAAPRQSGD